MLNITRLLSLANGDRPEPDPTDPTRPDHEKCTSGQENLGGARVNPTDPTDPTKKTAVATIQDAGAETPLSLSIPPAMAEDLLCCGYYAPEWTPAGCRRFLAELQAEWPGFEIRGWHGLTMPECWPVALMDAVESVYVMSIQDQGTTPEEHADEPI